MATPTKRTDLDFESFRARLAEEKALAASTIGGTKSAEGDDGASASGTDLAERSSGGDNHPADLATDLFLREEDMALVKNAQDILQQIERAMEKLEDGTYGLSDRSGEPIPKERLEAIPYATLTAAEQEIQEQS